MKRIRQAFYIVMDHPNGPTMTSDVGAVRHWLAEGYRVVRVTGTERVTEISLSIDDYEESWATPQSSTEDPK